MALKVDIKITGSDFTMRRLTQMGVNLQDFSDEFRDVGRELVDHFSGPVFDTEGAITGTRWSNLTKAYDFLKRRIWPGRGILEASGKLRKGFEYSSNKNMLVVENKEMPLFAYHQKGTRKMPARVIFRLNETLLDKVFNIIKNGLLGKIQRAMP